MTTPTVRRLVGGVAGLGLSTSVMSFTVGHVSSGGDRVAVSSAAHPGSDRIVLERLPTHDPAGLERPDDDAPSHRGTATMRVVQVTEPAPAPPPAAPTTAAWTVAPGDSLWGKAESVLASAWVGLRPTARYSPTGSRSSTKAAAAR